MTVSSPKDVGMTPHALPNNPATRIRDAAASLEPALVALRRDLHAHPELAFEETRTAGIVAAELARLAIPHHTGLGGTGVLGVIEGGRPGPTLAIRADMDALPIAEETGLPFASTAPGKMHACGQDIHTVTLLGAAAILKDMAPMLAGRVLLVFQRAEEVLEGAAAMIADGAAEGWTSPSASTTTPTCRLGPSVTCAGRAWPRRIASTSWSAASRAMRRTPIPPSTRSSRLPPSSRRCRPW
jgi:metal-dependent amidase/aminoacylase/carboxypeptidase family protein